MPLSELEPNLSGRASRASYTSVSSRGTRGTRKAHLTQSDLLSTGVVSMLRTSTELGDIGSLAAGSSSRIPRPTQQRRSSGNTSRLSTSSTQTQAPKRPSNHNSRPSTSSAPRRSINSSLNVPQFVPDTLSPTVMDLPGSSPLIPHARNGSKDNRSYSLTTNVYGPPSRLTGPRSMTSLRHMEPVPRARSPYKYPTRLKRPGFRSPSPALSDITGMQHRRMYQAGSHVRRMRLQPPSMSPHDIGPFPYDPHFDRSIPAVMPLDLDVPLPPRHPLMIRNGSAPLLRPARSLRSAKSVRSNRTVESDGLSSGPPSMVPPTPQGYSPIEVMIHPAGNASHDSLAVRAPSIAPSTKSSEPLYYDYSEHFEDLKYKESMTPPPPSTALVSPLGFVERIKNILSEQATARLGPGPAQSEDDYFEDIAALVELPATPPPPDTSDSSSPLVKAVPDMPDPIELPASPVPRRITREMILAIIQPSSAKEPTSSVEVKVNIECIPESASSHSSSDSFTGSMSTAQEHPPTPPPKDDNSQRESSVGGLNSRGSIAAATQSDTTPRCSSPQHHDSVKSIATSTLEQHLEPRVPVPIASLQVPASPENLEKPLPPTPSTGISSFNFSSVRAKSMMLTSPSALDEAKARKSAPSLRSSNAQVERHDQSDVSVALSMPPPTSSVKVSFLNEVQTPRPDRSPEKSANAFMESPVPSSITFATEASTPGSATVQSTTTVSVPAKSFGSREVKDAKETRDSNNTTTHLVWPIKRQSFPCFDTRDEEDPSRNSTYKDNSIVNDLRLSNAPRYPSQLSDVKEDPLEESAQDLRASTNFKFPLPRGMGRGVSLEEIYYRDSTTTGTGTTTARNSAATHKSNLADTRLIPSMNFSRMDLFTKLNEALEDRANEVVDGRGALSMDGAPAELHQRRSLDLGRPQSYGPMREKYRSFFASLDELGKDSGPAPELYPKTPEIVQPGPEEKKSEEMTNTSIDRRPYSPEDLLTEVERLSIPSVSGLTQRLSELIPELRSHGSREYVDDIETMIQDEELKEDVEEIRHVGDRPGLLNNMKSSARLRALPGKNVLVVIEDDVYEELTQGEKCAGSQGSGSQSHMPQKQSNASSKGHRLDRKDSVAEFFEDGLTPAGLEVPAPAHVRATSAKDVDRHDQKTPQRSPMSFKPWNLGMKFPWNESTSGIDITFPAKIHTRDAPSSRQSKLRDRLSLSSEYLTDVTNNGIGEHTCSTDAADSPDTFKHTAKGSRPSVLGSISRRVGRSLGLDNSGTWNGFDSTVTEDQAHDPGDRYPTTSLSPPAHFNLDEVRSFFSDDSSHRRTGSNFRRRLTHLRLKVAAAPRAQTAMDMRGANPENNGSITDSRIGMGGSVHTYEGTTGMPRSEYRTKKFFDKIKEVWFRTGELLRNMSGKRRAEKQETREWLQDSDLNLGTYTGA
ncbi:uncharacterized protein K452DRAFT_356742 [Aplosporella prunicola CBS 121167]|uniref:Uncharacterized protein n=1 Tax=Aplosporella prunicola CBS 121167 TaxID=1176127 RepID=A0A6A6BKD1_9PEZI|nr:uncharacterized protein K452DRAFT_356742 [Aplosporella prunicola CBS 121167]KAF2144582.1 hypothetical protein K452DRAFT_356742 [Aplosporella prunicola CBS 121167]